MWLKKQLVGGGCVPVGKYNLRGDQIHFQGAVTEDEHEAAFPAGFYLGITGGTGKYKYATGEIFVEGARGITVAVGGSPKPTPTRYTPRFMCVE